MVYVALERVVSGTPLSIWIPPHMGPHTVHYMVTLLAGYLQTWGTHLGHTVQDLSTDVMLLAGYIQTWDTHVGHTVQDLSTDITLLVGYIQTQDPVDMDVFNLWQLHQ